MLKNMYENKVTLILISIFLMASAPPPKQLFQDTSLERRCAALGDHIGEFVVSSLKGLPVTELSCAEGAGIGGITYAWEFATGMGSRQQRWQIDVAIPEASPVIVRLCDLNGSPVECSPPGKVAFGNGGRFKTKGDADAATQVFLNLHKNMGQLLPFISNWVGTTNGEVTYLGTSLRQYAADLAAKPEVQLPMGKAATVSVKLVRNKESMGGQLSVSGKGASEFAECLGCKKTNCAGETLHWRLDARLFSVTRGDEKFVEGGRGVHWFVDGSRTSPFDTRSWRFSCGVSRWSIQHMRVENQADQKK